MCFLLIYLHYMNCISIDASFRGLTTGNRPAPVPEWGHYRPTVSVSNPCSPLSERSSIARHSDHSPRSHGRRRRPCHHHCVLVWHGRCGALIHLRPVLVALRTLCQRGRDAQPSGSPPSISASRRAADAACMAVRWTFRAVSCRPFKRLAERSIGSRAGRTHELRGKTCGKAQEARGETRGEASRAREELHH